MNVYSVWYSQFLYHTYPQCHVVYSQRLTHIQQVVSGPVMQTLEDELMRTEATLTQLQEKKSQLKAKLEQAQKQTESEA